MNELSRRQPGAGVSSSVKSAYPRKQVLSGDGLFLRTPFSAAVADGSPLSKLSPRRSEFSDAGSFGLANKPLAAKPYHDMFTNGDLPPMFALLSNYLATKYPGVRRVILEVDDMPHAGSGDHLYPQPEHANRNN